MLASRAVLAVFLLLTLLQPKSNVLAFVVRTSFTFTFLSPKNRPAASNSLNILQSEATPAQSNDATPATALSIEPTVYVSDLYAALSVQPNATAAEIKDAYKALMFQNHPDRNDSTEALYIFRNASYAYQILGRDPRLKSDYDSTRLSRLYMNVLEDVGTDVLRPLAMDVAVPLINFTAQAVSSFLKPLFKSISETSNTISEDVKSISEDASLQDLDALGTLQKVGERIEMRSYESRLRATVERAARTSAQISKAKLDIAAAAAQEETSLQSVRDLEILSNAISLRRTKQADVEASCKQVFDKALADEATLKEQATSGTEQVSSITKEAESVEKELSDSIAEVTRLEAALAIAKQRADTLSVQKSTILESLSALVSSSEALQEKCKVATLVKTEKEEQLIAAEKDRISSDLEFDTLKADLIVKQADQARYKTSKESLQRLAAQLKLKNDTLTSLIQKMEMERFASVEAKRTRDAEVARLKESAAIEAVKRSQEIRRLELEKLQRNQERLMQEDAADDERLRAMLKPRQEADS